MSLEASRRGSRDLAPLAAIAGLVSLALASGCGARSDLDDFVFVASPVARSDGGDARDAARPRDAGDARLKDAVADRTVVDAPRDAPPDVGKDGGDAGHDTGPDATRDAAVDACHDDGGGGDGGLQVVVAAPVGDFDVDDLGIVFASGGSIFSCPLSGCGCEPPTVLADAVFVRSDSGVRNDLYALRIGSDQVFVFASSGLYAQSRTGPGLTLLATFDSVHIDSGFEKCTNLADGVLEGATGSTPFYIPFCGGSLGGEDGPLIVLTPSGLVPASPRTQNEAVTANGPSFYRASPPFNRDFDAGGPPFVITQLDIETPSAPPVVYASLGNDSATMIAATDVAVFWGTASGSAFACAAGAPCTQPVSVTCEGGFPTQPVAAYHDRIFFEEYLPSTTTWSFTSYSASALLAGVCAPTPVVALHDVGELRVVARETEVYFQAEQGIVRVAR